MRSKNDLTSEHDETLKAQLGLGLIQAFQATDADQAQNDAVRAWNDGHMKLWQERGGLEASGIQSPEEGKKKKKMGHTIRIDSPDHNLGALAPAIVAAAALLGGMGLGAAWLLKGSEKPAASATAGDQDTDTRSTLRPWKGSH